MRLGHESAMAILIILNKRQWKLFFGENVIIHSETLGY